MADRTFKLPRVLDKKVYIYAGSFAPNGSSAVSASSRKGLGFSVARTSQGVFTVTLDDAFPSSTYLLSATASLQLASGSLAARRCEIGAVSTTSKTYVISVVDGSAAAQDVAADANNRINFVLKFKNSTVV
jgi:hypothetical protein